MDIDDRVNRLEENANNQGLNMVELQCYFEALSELIIDQIAQGDQEQKNLLALHLEKLHNEIFYKKYPKKV